MNTKNLLALTLLATSLTLNATVAQHTNIITKQQNSSISSKLATILHKRGLDEDKAIEISKNFIDENEELFSLMMHNLINSSSYTQKEVLNQLSMMALQRKNIDLTSYSSLVSLAHSMSKRTLGSETLKNLEAIATKNMLLAKIFV